jgi:hypothetical protein
LQQNWPTALQGSLYLAHTHTVGVSYQKAKQGRAPMLPCACAVHHMQMEDDSLQQVLQMVIVHTTNTRLLIKCSSLNIRTRLFTQSCICQRVAQLLPAAVKDVYSQQLSKKRPQLILKKVTVSLRAQLGKAETVLQPSSSLLKHAAWFDNGHVCILAICPAVPTATVQAVPGQAGSCCI